MTRSFIFTIVISAYAVSSLSFANDNLQTTYEASNYLRTPRYTEAVEFCKRLDSASHFVKYVSFGLSPQGRELPLLIVDRSQTFVPPHNDRLVLLVLACIHAGESDGKDAGFLIIRDFIKDGVLSKEFEDIVLLFVPIFNVDGHERFGPYNRINQNGPVEMGFRTTAQGLNLNRDFLKADAPEMRAWLSLFNEWLPDMMVDCHVTDGADYQYVVSYGIETHDNMVEPLRSWTNRLLLPKLDSAMAKRDFPIVPYVMTRHYENISKGMYGFIWTPRYSTGYGVIQNRPALLIETHMLKDYRSRVDGTRVTIEELIKLLSAERHELKEAVRTADAYVADSLMGRYIRLNYKRSPDTTRYIDFKGYDVSVVPSELSGDDWVQWVDTPTDYKVPYLDTYYAVDSAIVPCAYLVPPEWTDELEVLEAHGIQMERLNKAESFTVQSYRFFNLRWDPERYEGRSTLEFEMKPVMFTKTFPVGTVVIRMNHRSNQVAAHLLEPKAPDSFIRWGFFSTIYEQKEYFEQYVMESIARSMLRDQPELKTEFQDWLEADSSRVSDPYERLNFFYQRSPYADSTLDLYPVGKLLSPCGPE